MFGDVDGLGADQRVSNELAASDGGVEGGAQDGAELGDRGRGKCKTLVSVPLSCRTGYRPWGSRGNQRCPRTIVRASEPVKPFLDCSRAESIEGRGARRRDDVPLDRPAIDHDRGGADAAGGLQLSEPRSEVRRQ